MTAKNDKKNSRRKKRKTSDNPIKLFQRAVFRSSNIKAGISKARMIVLPSQIPIIVKELSKNKMFYTHFCVHEFPKTLADLTHKKRLSQADPAREFIWSASILSLYKDKLSNFAQLREAFEAKYLEGELDSCHEILEEVENSLGVSIWLISRKIQLLQLKSGFKSQKDYLEEVINTEGISGTVALLSWFFSLRCEGSVSLEMLESELSDMLDHSAGLRDYVIYQICPYDLTKIDDESHPISWEENHTIIDRYMAFVWMSELTISQSMGEPTAYVATSLKLLMEIDDPRINNLFSLLNGKTVSLGESSQIPSYDSYTEGRYDEVDYNSADLIELKARTNLFNPRPSIETSASKLEEEIYLKMGEMLVITGDYKKVKQSLQKMAITCFQMPISVKIAAFIERDPETIFNGNLSNLDCLSIVMTSQNPWGCKALNRIISAENYLEDMIKAHNQSSSLLLQKALNIDYEDGLNLLDTLDLPLYRKEMYRGHISFKHGKLVEATEYYKTLLNEHNNYVISRANLYLYKVLFAQARYKDCIELVVSHYFLNPSVVAVYPLSDLVEAGLSEQALNSDLSLAILLSLAARHINSNLENELSDIYENILFKLGVNKPSEIEDIEISFKRDELVYFLRYICVQRVMDDTIVFESMSEIEEERIKICRLLIEIDSKNLQSYSTEIKLIIRNEKIADLLNQVHASKVYVNEDGILSSSEEKMIGLFSRYKKLLESPELNYQANKLSKKMEELIGGSANIDFKNIHLPASEKDSVFEGLLTYFIDQFAFNPAYGLDVNISTTIRHGSFEGHIRRAFAIRGLLCEHKTDSKKLILPLIWENHFSDFSYEEKVHLLKCMEKFTLKFENIIKHYLDELLRVCSDKDPDGLFVFYCSSENITEFMNSFDNAVTYEELVSSFFSFSWDLVDSSMENIRHSLSEDMHPKIIQAANTLVLSVERKIKHEKVVELVDAIATAKTDLNVLMDTVLNWFHRPVSQGYEPLEIELSIDVAIKQVENCYVNNRLELHTNVNVNSKIKGKYFWGIVEVFFIILQNVARHGNFDKGYSDVWINVSQDNKNIHIEVVNDFPKDVDLDEISKMAKKAEHNYKRDTAMNMAKMEGGSGLSKVWRVLEYDFKCVHSLVLDVDDNYKFTAMLTFDCSEIVESQLC